MWYIGNTKIVVTDFNESDSQIIARLQPLASGTVHHIFGYEDPIVKLSAVIIGDADKDAIRGYSKTSLSYSLTLDDGVTVTDYGDYLVKSVSTKREPVIKQSIREDLDCRSAVYSAEIELFRVFE